MHPHPPFGHLPPKGGRIAVPPPAHRTSMRRKCHHLPLATLRVRCPPNEDHIWGRCPLGRGDELGCTVLLGDLYVTGCNLYLANWRDFETDFTLVIC